MPASRRGNRVGELTSVDRRRESQVERIQTEDATRVFTHYTPSQACLIVSARRSSSLLPCQRTRPLPSTTM
jgi:hypothetical protein